MADWDVVEETKRAPSDWEVEEQTPVAPAQPNLKPLEKHFEETKSQLLAPPARPETKTIQQETKVPIDTSRPIIQNQDGTFSTERTITIEQDGKHYVIPTIVNGKPLTEEAAVESFNKGENKPVGIFDSAEKADTYAKERSQEIGQVRGAEATQQKDESSFLDWVEKVWGVSKNALKSGYQSSVTGLMTHGSLPESIPPEDAAWYARIAYQLGLVGGDAPWMIPGAVLGGAAGGAVGSAVPGGTAAGTLVGGGAGAFMLPEAMRTLLMQGYEKGDIKNFHDFFDRAAALFISTGKAGIVGGLTSAAGPVAGKIVGPAAGPILKTAAETGAAITTMVTVGKALEGQVPSAQDFLDAAVVLGAMKGAVAIAGKLRAVYAQTGRSPDQVVQDAQKEPSIKQDLLSSNVEIPKVYEPLISKEGPQTSIEIVGGKTEPEIGKTVEPVEPKIGEEPKLPEELPRPPESPEPSVAQQAVLDRIAKSPEKPGFTWDQLYTNTINDFHPIFSAVEEMGGKDLPVSEHAGKLAQLTRGAFGKADAFLEFGPFDFNTYQTTGKGLKQILEPFKDDMDGFRAFAAAKRAVELEDRGIITGFPMEQAKDVVAQGEETYGKAFGELLDYQRSLVDYLKQSGLLSDDAYQAMLEANKNYVPFYRLIEEGGGKGGGTSKGLQARNPIKRIKGSERQILDPIESIIKNTYLYISLAERNAVGKAFVELVEQSPHGGDFAQRVQRPMRPIELGSGEVDRLLKQYDVQTDSPDAFSIFRPGILTPKANEIVVFRNGKPELWETDKDVAAAFKATDKETAPWLLKLLSMPASALRAGATLTPDFMVRNYSRDQLSAFVFSKNGYIPVLDFMRGAWSIFSKDEDFQNWLKSGGPNAALVALDRRYIQENVFKLDKEAGLASRAWNVAKSPLEFLRIASELVENSTRLGEFKRVTEGETSKEAIQEGGFSSREVTLDFARIGAKTQAMNMITAFFNAQIQGVDRAVRAFGENPIGTAAKIAAGITLPSILLWWVNHDDPRWKEIPQWQKDLFWLIMTKDHVYRIPKPFELGVTFGSVPERILDSYIDKNPRAFHMLTQSMMNAFLPNFVPTAAVPLLEQMTNYSFFRDAPLISSTAEKLLPEYQYSDYTSELTKAVGSFVGQFPGMHESSFASPPVIDNYIRQWTGGTGSYVMQMLDASLRHAGILPNPVQPAATLADIPVVKAFVIRYPSAQAQSIQDFDDRSAKAEKIYDTVKFLAKQGDFDSMVKELKIGEDQMMRLRDIRTALGEQNRMIHLVNLNPNIPPAEKRQIIDAIYYQMIEASRAGNKMLDAVEKTLAKPQ